MALSIKSIGFAFALCCCLVPSITSGQLPDGFIREQIVTGLNPTSLTIVPDGSAYITEKHGVIRIIRDGHLLPEPLMSIEVDDSNERGLGHLVFHPDYSSNGFFYVYYSVPGLNRNRISRFTSNGDKVIPGSELILLDMDELGTDVHNGGAMVFGTDGYLYIATGDGAQAWNGEDLGSPYGKILRMDEWGNPVPDNPYYHEEYRFIKYVYASGLRNPFTIAQHPVTYDIYANDVGWEKAEEINLIKRGAYYGWPNVEGKRTTEDVPENYEDPIFDYKHQHGFCCIVGAAVYPPTSHQFPPQYRGKYFFSDYCTGDMRVLNLETNRVESVFLGDGDRVIDIDVDASGSLYYVERRGLGDGSGHDNLSTTEGTIWKVSYTGSGSPFIAVHPEPLLLSQGEDATFSVSASGAEPLFYEWFLNGELIEQSASATFTLPGVTMEQDSAIIAVDVSNAYGIVSSKTAMLRVTVNKRPLGTIVSPDPTFYYRAGDVITFNGFGTDAETGILPDSCLQWRIDFHHGTHAHPAMGWVRGITGGMYEIPSSGETADDVWYRIYLRVEDHEGLSHTSFIDLFPHIGSIHVRTQPPGLVINLDGFPVKTPYSIDGVQGMNRYITAPKKQVYGDSIYYFSHWSDGVLSANRQIKANDNNQSYVAMFTAVGRGHGTGLTTTIYSSIDWQGEPVAMALDSMVNHNYLFGPPVTGMDNDFFSITWQGYLQAYHTGWYDLVVFADDGIYLQIDSIARIDDQELGWKRRSDSVYLESGKLYPLFIKYFEHTWGAQLKLRWSSEYFDEELIPTSQLYPTDYLEKPGILGIRQIASLQGNTLFYETETSEERNVTLTLTDILGRVVVTLSHHIPVGKSSFSWPLGPIPVGMYWVRISYEHGRLVQLLPVQKLE